MCHTGVCEKDEEYNSSGEEDTWEDKLSKRQVRHHTTNTRSTLRMKKLYIVNWYDE